MEGQGQRRLGAIMFTDVVGYSAMASQNEERALQLVGEHGSLLQALFSRYNGRIVKSTGDGFLVEFASAVEAVNCSAECQKEMERFNQGRRPDEKILIRIGIHVGDIIHSDGDVLGDAVNVAARVQPLAEPGGVCVTRQVVDQVERKVPFRMARMGTRELKNIGYTVEVYKVMMPSDTSSANRQELDPHRIAILPFTNMSADPNDRYFAEGMTEELISTVSRIGELSVISRTSVMRYKDTTVPIGEIGMELSAGSILEGSVRKAGNRVRITTQLIDAGSDKHLWAQSYDRDLTDVFAIQGDIAQQVADALKVQLLSKEKQSIMKSSHVDPDAYTLYLKGRFYWNERTEEGQRRALKYFEEAIRIDPGFALGYSGIADCYIILADYAWMNPVEAAPKAREYAAKALELDDSLAEAHASLGLALLNFSWDFKRAEAELKRALELRPNYATALHWYGNLLYSVRRYDEISALEKRAYELDPYSRIIGNGIAVDLMIHGRTEEAMEQFKRVIELNPDFAAAHFWKAWAYACVDEYDKAIGEAKRAVELGEGNSPKLFLAWVYAASGQKENAERVLDEVLSNGGYVQPAFVGDIKFLLGHEDEAFVWLKKGLEAKDTTLLSIGVSPQQRKLVSDPRWAVIESEIGLPAGTKFPEFAKRT